MPNVKGIAILLSALILASCGGGGGGGGSSPPPGGGGNGGGNGGDGGGGGSSGPDVTTFFTDMQTWQDFAPKSRDEANEGIEIVDDSVEPVVETVTDPNNNLKECTSERVDFFETPEEYVMFAPPTNILYPGAMVVGESLRDGATAGDILPINVAQRTEIDVSIPACNFAGNTRRVAPTLSAVNAAVGDIINEAQNAGVDCINPQGNLRVETYRNEAQRALRAGVSGRYFGFSSSASGSYSKDKVENSVASVFRESLYTVDISAPQSPADWFSDEFTPELLQQQIDQGTMGQDNVPAYVARVTYGRIMTATMTSSNSEEDMRAAFEFKYQNPAVTVEGDAAARSQRIREESRMTLSYLGGSAEASTAMLQSQDWTQYFGVPVQAEDAVPISFEIRSVKDNVPAVVQELTSYDRTICTDRAGAEEVFIFEPERQFVPSFSAAGQVVAVGDIDGENGDDLVWAASALGARGEIAVALSNGDGTFQTLVNEEIGAVNGQSGEFSLLLADVDNDGAKDIILSLRPASDGTTAYVSFYRDGGFVHSAPQKLHDSGGFNNYFAYTAQIDGIDGADLVFNNVPNPAADRNRTWIAVAADASAPDFDFENDTLFTMLEDPFDNPFHADFSGFEYTHIADFNGDGRDDIVWQNIDSGSNYFWWAFGVEDGLRFRDRQVLSLNNYDTYTALAGDADGNGVADLIEPHSEAVAGQFRIHLGEGSGISADGSGNLIDPYAFRDYDDPSEQAALRDLFGPATATGNDDPRRAESPPDVLLADVDGNGSDDMLINDKGYRNPLTNQVVVGLGIVGGSQYTFTRAPQVLAPAIDWSQYRAYVGDVNGDGREDLLWIASAASNSVYIALAR